MDNLPRFHFCEFNVGGCDVRALSGAAKSRPKTQTKAKWRALPQEQGLTEQSPTSCRTPFAFHAERRWRHTPQIHSASRACPRGVVATDPKAMPCQMPMSARVLAQTAVARWSGGHRTNRRNVLTLTSTKPTEIEGASRRQLRVPTATRSLEVPHPNVLSEGAMTSHRVTCNIL